MFKKALLLTLLACHLNACALCALYTPSATVNIHLDGTPTHLDSITFQWTFTQDFIKVLLERYDSNKNQKLDKNELERIKIILENYIHKHRYLTQIEYLNATASMQEQTTQLPLHVSEKNLFLEGETLLFTFKASLHQPLSPNDEITFVIEDKEGYFNFLIHDITHGIEKPFAMEYNLYNHVAFLKITDTLVPQHTLDANHVAHEPRSTPPAMQQPTNSTPSWLQTHLTQMQERIQETMKSLKEQATLGAYALFLGSSFLYGLLHAAGPGHGKALVSSYLFASSHRYPKAITMSALIGLVHTFSAFILTLIIYALFDLFFNAFFTNVTYYATKLSALMIIGIAGYLAWKKLSALKHTPKIVSFSAHPFACHCAGCSQKSQSTDWGVVLSAGIVPCPGTITIFIFALSTGAYLLGFLAALSMSLGMSFMIALASLSTLFAKNRFKTHNTKMIFYSESLSLIIMLSLGIVLLFL
ncbi:nickel/cobalt transporter [Sulfurospirillum barnesii]|uniref:Nickel/cobalt efflux system n=1 Tax=Sulfurospirillum barnesii (strain ATCC 700032 / DSM 10660 / SES-3) TaxID=760154 RepID=I3XZP6_SULBS|nr:DUF1007 family protein [Sulfurospirillum barnesii]AFL69420.1 ABC-type uncharacterized transport system, permease component [Sulfurospirillum barnesii SES-3]